jgi:hypothetical protein
VNADQLFSSARIGSKYSAKRFGFSADALHRLEPDAWDFGRRRLGQFHRAGIVVFASQHKKRAPVGVDTPDAFPGIPLAGIEGDVPKEHLRAAWWAAFRQQYNVGGYLNVCMPTSYRNRR